MIDCEKCAHLERKAVTRSLLFLVPVATGINLLVVLGVGYQVLDRCEKVIPQTISTNSIE